MFDNLDDLLDTITPDIREHLKTAVELGKWPNGTPLKKEQRALCLQAIIAWDEKHLPETERTGYVKPKPTPCGPDTTVPLQFK